MKNTEINELLKKYWDAESSLEEEAQLAAYFKSDAVAPDHLPYKDLFLYYDMVGNMSLEESSKVITLSHNINRIRRSILGIAASLLLLLSAGIFFINNEVNEPSYYGKTTVITEEEEALEITKDALAFLSFKLDESSKNITSDVQKMEKISILK